jgi:DNA-binding response OmpR family regulator
LRILVIEDNPDIKEILDFILQDEGYEAISCSDGSSLSNLDQLQPSLILIDEILEGARGSELIKQLKLDKSQSKIPVVLMSAFPHIKKIAKECGADGYIEKPFNLDTLVATIKNLL